MLKRLFSLLIIKLKFKNKVKVHYSCCLSRDAFFEGGNKLYPKSKFKGRLGFGSYIGNNSNISAVVGRFTSIGIDVKTIIGTHPYTYPYGTTSPMFYSLNKQAGMTFAENKIFKEELYYNKDRNNIAVKIGNDCWIGERVLIIGGVKIGNGAVILAGAIVTKDVADYAIIGGVPAKIIGYRYSDKDIESLLLLQWWNKDIPWLKKNYLNIFNVKKLLRIRL